MSLKKVKRFIATDKHSIMKEHTVIRVLDDGRFTTGGVGGSKYLLKAWIKEGWCVEEEEAKWTDSELKEMCIAYAREAHLHIFHPTGIEGAFDTWFAESNRSKQL